MGLMHTVGILILCSSMSQANYQEWNYFVLNINIATAAASPSPEEASKKLKGTLSPTFIQDQFPEEYKEFKQDEPMELQLQKKLDLLGSQGWELISISEVGPKLLFFFKRPDAIGAG
jgi:hypothetical protein